MKITKIIELFYKFAAIPIYPKCKRCGNADPYIGDSGLCYKCFEPEKEEEMVTTSPSAKKLSNEITFIINDGFNIKVTIKSLAIQNNSLAIIYEFETQNNKGEIDATIWGMFDDKINKIIANGDDVTNTNFMVLDKALKGNDREKMLFKYPSILSPHVMINYFKQKGRMISEFKTSSGDLFDIEKIKQLADPNGVLI